MRQNRSDREHLLECLGSDDTGLMEQCIDGDVERRQGTCMRGRCPTPGLGSAGLHGDDRLLASHPRCDPGETAGIPERLQIQQDDIGRRVVLPMQEQIVSGHIRLVAHRDELADAQPVALGVLEDGDSERPRLRRHRNIAGRWVDRGEGPVHGDGWRGVEEPHAVGTDHAHPASSDDFEELFLESIAFTADLAEPGGDHDETSHTLRRTLPGGLEGVTRRDGDERQVDLVGDVGDRWVGLH